MSHEIVIRGGQLVDGTGAAPIHADLAIDNGLITVLGEVDGRGKREIDAQGHIVSPGFVDLHAHLDAQIGWDPDLTPVSWHGVTTVLIGNCGVTFAPCRPNDRELLAGMMETVEDIPKHAILTGLPWTWESYGSYLDALDKLNPGINVAGLVGHCAVRYYVMGERAVEEQATAEERKQMADIVGQSLDNGAFGFSTNRYAPHKLPDGRSIPGTFADPVELFEIGKAISARNGLLQSVGTDHKLLKQLGEQNRLLFSYGTGAQKGNGQQAADWLDQICDGGDITAITQVRGSGFMFGLQCALPFKGDTWSKLRRMDLAGRLAALNDAQTAAKLIAEGSATTFQFSLENVYFLGAGETPDYTAPREDNMAKLCSAGNEDFAAVFVRLARETNGRGLFNLRMFNQDIGELGDLFKNKHIFPSLGDSGAHVSQIMDAGWSTFTLSHWIRGTGTYSLAEGIRRMTSGPARVMGLKDRGVLKVGMRADVNVFDYDRVTELQPELVHDFPGGAPRFIQRARGYKATIVNGQVNVFEDQHTGARAGQVLRHRG